MGGQPIGAADLVAAAFGSRLCPRRPSRAAHVSLDTTGNVVGMYGSPQRQNSDYAEISDSDPRLLAHQARLVATGAYNSAMAAGIAVPSTPALNGTCAIDPASQQKAASVALQIAVNGKIPAGQTALAWPNISGAPLSLPTTAEFQAFAAALGDYVTTLGLGQTPRQSVQL